MKPSKSAGKPLLDEAQAAERYAHGTHARYTLAHCKCEPCKKAHRDYTNALSEARRPPWRLVAGMGHIVENRHTRDRLRPFPDRASAIEKRDRLNKRWMPKPPNEFVSAAVARRHVKRLVRSGVGLRSIAIAAKVSRTVLSKIVSGEIPRTRRSTEAKLLAVDAGAALGLIDGTPTWTLLRSLIECKLFTKTWVAKQLGMTIANLRIRDGYKVQPTTARRVRDLYDRVWATDKRFRTIVDPEGERMRDVAAREAAAAARVVAAKARTAELERRKAGGPSEARARLARALAGWGADEFAVRFDRLRLDRLADENIAS
jgi:hypothetical protein